jgi:hypothetical protein
MNEEDPDICAQARALCMEAVIGTFKKCLAEDVVGGGP